jgi:protocatechuate 3,4-dioxygenase beta subunit
MSVRLKEQITSFIISLPNVERKHDPMSEEAYFYGLRNFAHFHGPKHIDIRLSKPQQEEALQTHLAFKHQYAPQAGWVSCIVESEEQAENTKRLLKQAYDTCVSLKTSHKQAN